MQMYVLGGGTLGVLGGQQANEMAFRVHLQGVEQAGCPVHRV